MTDKLDTTINSTDGHGATTVEYAIVVALFVLAVVAGAWMLVDPRLQQAMNSALPRTFDSMVNRIGTFGAVDEYTNRYINLSIPI